MLESYLAKRKLGELLQYWTEFHGIVMESLGAAEVTDEREARFFELKGRIAERLPLLTTATPASMAPECAIETKRMTEVLNRYRSLKVETPLGPNEKTEFDRNWHLLFIFLNKLKGVPLAQAPARPKTRLLRAPTGVPLNRRFGSMPGARFFGFVLRLGVFFLFLYLLGRAFGLRWETGGHVTAELPKSVSGAGQNVAGALASIWTGLTHIMDPVVAAYGSVVTLILVGVLLTGIGYWLLARG